MTGESIEVEMPKRMSKKELRELVFCKTLEHCREQNYDTSDILHTVFAAGCVFGFALNDPIQFESWELAGKAFAEAMEE